MITPDDDALRGLRALAAGEDNNDAARAKATIMKLGGKGTAKDARDMLAALGVPLEDPAQTQRNEVRARMGIAGIRTGFYWDPNHPKDRVFGLMTKEQAHAELVRRAEAGDLDASQALAANRARRE